MEGTAPRRPHRNRRPVDDDAEATASTGADATASTGADATASTGAAAGRENRPFWEAKRLAEMSADEWELLCDGCGKCCLEKLEDSETGAISHTDVACRLLDLTSCRCRHYANRRRWVSNCEQLDPVNVQAFKWLPSSCAYRLLAEGRPLPWWHHLVSGDPDLVHRVGASVRGRAVSPRHSGPLEHHIVDWPA